MSGPNCLLYRVKVCRGSSVLRIESTQQPGGGRVPGSGRIDHVGRRGRDCDAPSGMVDGCAICPRGGDEQGGRRSVGGEMSRLVGVADNERGVREQFGEARCALFDVAGARKGDGDVGAGLLCELGETLSGGGV